MKVAFYARVSSNQQAEKNNSIPSQLRLLHEYALKHNMEVVKEYVDEGESALSINRPAFLEMISETKKKFPPFQAILVWKLSRFARNRQDSIIYKSMLKKRGIEVTSISEPIDDTPFALICIVKTPHSHPVIKGEKGLCLLNTPL